MTNELELGRRGYFVEALLEQHNVIVVLGSAALSLSFASIWPLAVALGLECSWLLAAPRSAKFRAFVQRREREEQRALREAELKPFVDELDARAAPRFAALEALSLSVFESAEERGTTGGELSQLRSVLDRLSRAFLEFCALHAGLSRAIDEIPHAELSAELARAAELFAAERNLESRVALRQEQKVIQQRLLRRDNLLQAEHAAGLKLGAIENAVTHLRSRVLVSVAGAELVNEAETLLARIGSPRSLEAVLREERTPNEP
jgi:hypothetical protein